MVISGVSTNQSDGQLLLQYLLGIFLKHCDELLLAQACLSCHKHTTSSLNLLLLQFLRPLSLGFGDRRDIRVEG